MSFSATASPVPLSIGLMDAALAPLAASMTLAVCASRAVDLVVLASMGRCFRALLEQLRKVIEKA